MTSSRVRLGTRAILLAGFAAAAVIWVVNSRPSTSDFELERSKMYLHDLEVYGGRANVLADDFREWWSGLWRGRNLALSVAVLTVLAALAFRFVATPVPPAEPGGVSASGGTSGKTRPTRP
jgi:hypothetical protein